MHPHIKRRDLPSTAWTHAISFASTGAPDGTTDRANTTRWAAAAWFGYLAVHALFGHRNIYKTPSGLGCVVMYRKPARGMAARGVAGLLPGVVVSVDVQSRESAAAFALSYLCVAVYVALLLSLAVAISFSRNRRPAPTGTPRLPMPRSHVVLALAAARPNAPRGETFAFARELANAHPPGTTLVVHPRTPKLRRRYERSGYVPSKGLAMARIIKEPNP